MNDPVLTVFYIILCCVARVKSLTIIGDGCEEIRQTNGVKYTWSCVKSSDCRLESVDAIRVRTPIELFCDGRNLRRICCPKAHTSRSSPPSEKPSAQSDSERKTIPLYSRAYSMVKKGARVIVDCRSIDSDHSDHNLTWRCRKGPCRELPNSFLAENSLPCDPTDDAKVCCPESVDRDGSLEHEEALQSAADFQ